MKKPKNVEEYMDSLSPEVLKIALQFRRIIRKAAPGAEEGISYGMPYYKLHGRLVYFMAHTKHLGFYPMKSGVAALGKKYAGKYKTSAGTIQFPYDKPLPVALITKIVKIRLKENLAKAALKKK